MKQLKLLIQILKTDAEGYEKLSKEYWDDGKRYASEYAEGKADGYRSAINYLKAYINNELPWEEE